MKSISLHLVVAGATYFNQLDRFQGWSGTPLTAAGQRTVADLAQQLTALPFETAYTADTSHSVQTGQLILAANAGSATQQVSADLRAPFFGGFEGQERADVWSGFATKLGYASVASFAADQTPEELQTLLHDHDQSGLAESGTEFWTRYSRGLQQIWTKTTDHGHALVIVDAATLRELWFRATGERPHRSDLVPASYTQMTFDGDNLAVDEA